MATTIPAIPLVIGGAGVLGLAIGKRIINQFPNLEFLILEKNSKPGMITSSRSSEVIHAGLYYPTSSLKAESCVKGKVILKEYLNERNIKYNNCGKYIVATTSEEVIKLEQLKHQAMMNGVTDVYMLSGKDVAKMEPNISCQMALFSPSTSVFDVHSYINNLELDVLASPRSTILYNCTIEDVSKDDKFIIKTNQGLVQSSLFINVTGLNAIELVSNFKFYPQELLPQQYYCKGNYFKFIKNIQPFNSLIYPMPSHGGLGIHSTLDVNNVVKFGPDTEWLSHNNTTTFDSTIYNVDSSRAEQFYRSIRQYYPSLPDDSLEPYYSGIRPKLIGPNKMNNNAHRNNLHDFIIDTELKHKVNGLVNVFGYESPGITSSLYISNLICKIISMIM